MAVSYISISQPGPEFEEKEVAENSSFVLVYLITCIEPEDEYDEFSKLQLEEIGKYEWEKYDSEKKKQTQTQGCYFMAFDIHE